MTDLAQDLQLLGLGQRPAQFLLPRLEPAEDQVTQFRDDVVALLGGQLGRHGLQVTIDQVHLGQPLHSILSSEAPMARHSVVRAASIASPGADRR